MDKRKKVVVIGGVAGGMSFATRYRRLNMQDEIIVFEKGPYVSFANCGLPYFISGEIPSRARLLVVKEQDLVNRFRLDIRSNTEVLEIRSDRKVVTFMHQGKLLEQAYDILVLSTGAKPIIPNIPGLGKMPQFELRNIPDLDAIMKHLKEHQPKKAILIGGGYIGIEVAENLIHRGIQVALIEKAPEILPVFDYEIASYARKKLVEKGIQIFSNNEIVQVETDKVILRDGTILNGDMMITAIGVIPQSDLAKKVGIQLGPREGIMVDHHYETSLKDIYAIGDAIVVKHQVSGLDTLIPLASPANRQGRQLADILSGLPSSNRGSLGTAILRLFDLTLASTGLNERQLKGQEYEVIHVQGYDHVSYFPGAKIINLKVLYHPKTEMILGAQASGEQGVDKRIDVLATAIKAKMKITELQELELSYSPPYGSAKDLVNMVGYLAQNRLFGLTRIIQPNEVNAYQLKLAQFVDVRPIMERMAYGHIENDIHLELDQLHETWTTLDSKRPVVVYCDAGSKGYNAERILRSKGFDVYNLEGGFNLYQIMKGQ